MLKIFNRISPVSFFVVAAILCGISYSIIRPPMQSPDEFNHFCRAYQVSEGKFLPEKKNQRLGGEIPVCIEEFMSIYRPSTFVPGYRLTFKEVLQGFDVEFSPKNKVFKDFPNTAYYSPVSYLPQALALCVLRQFHCSVALMYHGSRMFVFLVWLISMFFVIRIIPLYKWLFSMLLLLPMSLYMAVSFSADTVTNILTLLLIASILRLAFGEKKITKKDLILILVIGVLLALTKIIYISLLFLLFIIPSEKFNSKKHKYFIVSVILIVSSLFTLYWSDVIMQHYISFEDYNITTRNSATLHHEANYYGQKDHMLHHPFHFFKVFYNSLIMHARFYLLSYVGHFGTYLDIPLPLWFLIISLPLIVFVSLAETTQFVLSYSQKFILLITAFISLFLLFLSQHLTWNKVGGDYIEAIQGRYFVPILPLIFMLFNTGRTKVKFNVAPIVIVFVFLANAYACYVLYDHYFKKSEASKMDFTCDMETVDIYHFLKTSNPDITLEGGDKRTTVEHRNGRYALALPPDSSFAATYEFKDLHVGDLIEIYVWQKGSGGEIVVQGHGTRCQPYRFINPDIQIIENSGWKKMQMIFIMFVECDSSEVTFNLQNPTKKTIYFDDLRYCVKKFK